MTDSLSFWYYDAPPVPTWIDPQVGNAEGGTAVTVTFASGTADPLAFLVADVGVALRQAAAADLAGGVLSTHNPPPLHLLLLRASV